MDRSTIYIIDDDGRRKDRTAQFLAGLAFDVKTLGSPSVVTSKARPARNWAVRSLRLPSSSMM